MDKKLDVNYQTAILKGGFYNERGETVTSPKYAAPPNPTKTNPTTSNGNGK